MMLAVEFADFGFGTVVGAVVTGSILVFLDQRRRKDEKKRLFLEEKRLMYRNITQAFEVLALQVVFYGKWNTHFERYEELDEEGVKLLGQMAHVLKESLTETQRRLWDDGTDFSLLASREAKRAATEALETMHQMLICMASEEPCDWSWMEVILREEIQIFRYYARQDLGIGA